MYTRTHAHARTHANTHTHTYTHGRIYTHYKMYLNVHIYLNECQPWCSKDLHDMHVIICEYVNANTVCLFLVY